MHLAYHLETTRRDFARHVDFLKACLVEHVPIFFMLNPEDYQPAFGSGTTFDQVLGTLERQVAEVRGQGLEVEDLILFPGAGIPNTIASDPDQQARFHQLCRWCGQHQIKRMGLFPRVENREEATPKWLEDIVAGARFMADTAAEDSISLGLHVNMIAGCRLDRVEDVEDFYARVDRPNWGLMFCFGCLALAGLDLPAMVHKWGERIVLVDLRDVRGTWKNCAEEAQFGTGRIDLAGGLRALREIGYQGILRPEHFPRLDAVSSPEERKLFTQPNDPDPVSVAWTLAYTRGLLSAL
ncbi:MAG: sugar phosphate isomerase/epimerase [candidate division WS1 bacterium]|nr:sugar phosphate isomerase/epimerase [candidate division WS1 bacterium]